MDASTDKPPHCDHCHGVIGVYEPLVALLDGQVIETSRAARADAAALGEGCYHRACYVHRHRGPPVSAQIS